MSWRSLKLSKNFENFGLFCHFSSGLRFCPFLGQIDLFLSLFQRPPRHSTNLYLLQTKRGTSQLSIHAQYDVFRHLKEFLRLFEVVENFWNFWDFWPLMPHGPPKHVFSTFSCHLWARLQGSCHTSIMRTFQKPKVTCFSVPTPCSVHVLSNWNDFCGTLKTRKYDEKLVILSIFWLSRQNGRLGPVFSKVCDFAAPDANIGVATAPKIFFTSPTRVKLGLCKVWRLETV